MPLPLGARTMLSAMRDWIVQRKDIGKIKLIRVCLLEQDTLHAFYEQFGEMFGEAGEAEESDDFVKVEEESKEEP